ncbi:MAG: hypothetical protein AAFX56_16655 [Pseudomonadota bacterium]
MQHCHANACDIAYCDDVSLESCEVRTPWWRVVPEALVHAVNHLHHYRNLRARTFSQAMHEFDCEDRP